MPIFQNSCEEKAFVNEQMRDEIGRGTIEKNSNKAKQETTRMATENKRRLSSTRRAEGDLKRLVKDFGQRINDEIDVT